MSELEKSLYDEAIRESSSLTKLSLILGKNWDRQSLLNIRKQKTFDELKGEYDLIVNYKKTTRSRRDYHRTEFELKFERLLKKVTKIQFYKQFWIGDFCFDFFVPGLGGNLEIKRMKGLVIEIDGDVHNLEPKMRKDEIRGQFLRRLNIGHYSVSNRDVNNKSVREFQNLIKTNQRLDYRSKQRVLRVAYLATILTDIRSSKVKAFN